jgi:type II secretory pathway component PulF
MSQTEAQVLHVHQSNYNKIYWQILQEGDPTGELQEQLQQEKQKYLETKQELENNLAGDKRSYENPNDKFHYHY